MTKLIAKKSWSNASAFIQIDEQGNCCVYGKFYDGNRGYGGPMTDTLKTLSPELLEEAMETGFYSKPSPELQKVIDEIWRLAKEKEPWFGYKI